MVPKITGMKEAREWFKDYPEGGAFFDLYTESLYGVEMETGEYIFIVRHECNERGIRAKALDTIREAVLKNPTEPKLMGNLAEIRYRRN